MHSNPKFMKTPSNTQKDVIAKSLDVLKSIANAIKVASHAQNVVPVKDVKIVRKNMMGLNETICKTHNS
jgi:hypothetical protein